MEFQFYSGEDKRLKVRLKSKDCNDSSGPYSLALNSVVTFILPASPADLELTGTITNYDLGDVYVDLTDTQTAMMTSGDLIIKIQSGSVTRIAKKRNAVRKLKC